MTINCGEFGLICGYDAEANWNGCIADPNCTPNCLIDSGDPANPIVKQCGDDGCGNQCGICGDGLTCQDGSCEAGGTNECGDVDAIGQCTGDILEYCAAGELYTTDCALAGEVCAFDQDAGWYDCGSAEVPVSGGPLGGDCGLLTAKGYCADNVAYQCDNNAPSSDDCGAQGLYCAFDPGGTNQFGCIAPPSCVSSCPEDTRCQADGSCGCDGVDVVGQCEGDMLAYCLGDKIQTLECATMQKECGFDGSLFLCQ